MLPKINLTNTQCNTANTQCNTANTQCNTAITQCNTANTQCNTANTQCNTAITQCILQIPNVYCKYPMYTANTQYIKLLRVNTQFHKKLICFCDFFYTFAYGAKKSRAVMCNLNFPVFVNFPNVVPKLIRLGRAMCSAFFIRSSL